MEQNWTPTLAFVWRPENDGQPYHVTPHDPGAGTAYGVTEATWAYAVAHGYVEGDLKDASQGDLATILHAMFWLAARCQELPSGVDLLVFNMAMMSGVGRAVRILQRAVRAVEDGMIGPNTLRLIGAQKPADLVTLLADRDDDFFAGLTNAKWFYRGWSRRVFACEASALSIIHAPAASTPPAPAAAPQPALSSAE